MYKFVKKTAIILIVLLFCSVLSLSASEAEKTYTVTWSWDTNEKTQLYRYKIYSLTDSEVLTDWTELEPSENRTSVSLNGLTTEKSYICYVKESFDGSVWQLPSFSIWPPESDITATAEEIKEPETEPVETTDIDDTETVTAENRKSESYNLSWNWEMPTDYESKGFRYKFYSAVDGPESTEWGYEDDPTWAVRGYKTKASYADEDYVFEVQNTIDGENYSESGFGYWHDGIERERFMIGGYLPFSWNLKYFPNAELKGVRLVTFYTRPFEAYTAGVTASYRLFNFLSLGVDTTFNLFNYRKNLKDHYTQYSIELMGEVKFSFGDVSKSYRKMCMRTNISLLGGGALYTNLQDKNIVPGGGIKLSLDFYNESPFVISVLLRGTAFYMQQVDKRYNSIDTTICCGLGFSWNKIKK